MCVKIALSAPGQQNGHISPWLRLVVNPCTDGCTQEPNTVLVSESCLFVLIFRFFTILYIYIYTFAISRPHICLFVSSSFSAKLQAHRKTGVRLKVWLIHNPPTLHKVLVHADWHPSAGLYSQQLWSINPFKNNRPQFLLKPTASWISIKTVQKQPQPLKTPVCLASGEH